MLRNHRPHEQAAVAPALDRQFFRTRPFFLDQILGCGSEIIEHILLFGEISRFVPFFAELASAANVGHHINAAAIEPEAPREIEIWLHANAVAAVTVKQRRIIAVLLGSLSFERCSAEFSCRLSKWRIRA